MRLSFTSVWSTTGLMHNISSVVVSLCLLTRCTRQPLQSSHALITYYSTLIRKRCTPNCSMLVCTDFFNHQSINDSNQHHIRFSGQQTTPSLKSCRCQLGQDTTAHHPQRVPSENVLTRVSVAWVVLFTEDECLIGDVAKNTFHRNPLNTVFDAKHEHVFKCVMSLSKQ